MTDRDCKHGLLARSCDVCELETQRDEAEDAADRIGRTLVASEQRVADLETALREIREATDHVGASMLTPTESKIQAIAREALGESE